MTIPTKPCIRITSSGNQLSCSDGHRIPGGTRLEVTYSGGKVEPLTGTGLSLTGEVLSGADWLLVRDDGVVAFDARLTLGKNGDDIVVDVDAPAGYRFARSKTSPDDDFLINAVVYGVAPLNISKSALSVISGKFTAYLPVTFEAAGRVVQWAKPRFRQLAKNYPQYQLLAESQCLAQTLLEFSGGKVTSVTYDVYALA